jgi:hypothetical protein
MATREERQARRKAKKAERKRVKKLRKEKFNEILEASKHIDLKFDTDTEDPDFADAFNEIWPVLRPSLEYAELIRITGPKTDKILRTVVDIGHRISTGDAREEEQARFVSYLDSIWDIVETALGILKTFTPDNVDDIIDYVLEVGDWLTDNEDDDIV